MVAGKSKTPVDDFSAWLRRSELSSKTIRKHTENVDFYINEFLLYKGCTGAIRGSTQRWYVPRILVYQKGDVGERSIDKE
jgi:hypothetical protein